MYDAQQLRKLATLAGISVPESDERLLNCMGSILNSVTRQLDSLFKSREEMERNYTHQLGELARLSDVVCGEVLSYSNTDLFPENVMAAANEIMQYVDAVRPGEGEKETKWAMHIIGPDDVIPCVGEFDALRKANQHNKAFAKSFAEMPPDGFSPNDPYCVAIAELV